MRTENDRDRPSVDPMEFWLQGALAAAAFAADGCGAPAWLYVGFSVDDEASIADEVIGEGRVGMAAFPWHKALRIVTERRPDLAPFMREVPTGERSLCIALVGGEVRAAVLDHMFRFRSTEEDPP